ncbi:MAG: GatB/YqeY domain-containing protein [Gammaproteobacteria bacterium]|nr:GatB/YqeY domain-containing protein [Gammaproteobacteria bacterium]MDD9807554.1 GatB/YqeY domain-containing protein [Gammaproteobacteria bacterium]MDD9869762.1 GatB/YqeY domain-containing protein [Gammaproteobacteria bacterium]MDD9886192.1 GatB/YqeY domain-containing protein [Gammaproteobacteria bacterium]
MKSRIADDMKAALKSGDKRRLAVLRLMLSDIKRAEIDARAELNEAAILAVLNKMAKQRKESIGQFADAGRDDLREQEQFELGVIGDYLPEPLSGDELARLVERAVEQTGAADIKAMGKVMSAVKTLAEGRADMAEVSRLVKQRLSAP